MIIQQAEEKHKIHLTEPLLEAAGYTRVPSHTYARVKHEREWITGWNGLRQQWPRFHVLRDQKTWRLHLDFKPVEGRHASAEFGPQVIGEINRLKQTQKEIKGMKQRARTPASPR